MYPLLRSLASLFILVHALPLGAQADEVNYTRNWTVEGGERDILALVIGNSIYQHNGQLAEPANDAQTIATALRDQGAEVMVAYNLQRTQMKDRFREFARKLRSFRAGLVYFAGHGFQVRGQNYLVPVDANPYTIDEVALECVELRRLLDWINDGEKPKIILLDACRDNPFSRNWEVGERSSSVGFAAIKRQRNSLIMFSTAEGTRVRDDNPFAEVFAEEVRNGTCHQDLWQNVFKKVEAIDRQQQVYVQGGLLEPLCFGESPPEPVGRTVGTRSPEASSGTADEDGEGVVRDEQEGEKWLRTAAQQGHEKAIATLEQR